MLRGLTKDALSNGLTDMEDGLVSHNVAHHISLALRSSRQIGVMRSNIQVVTYK